MGYYKRLLMKVATVQPAQQQQTVLSQGWGEGRAIDIEGIDKAIRKTYDNVQEGNRWHPGKSDVAGMKQKPISQNQYIKMKLREGAEER